MKQTSLKHKLLVFLLCMLVTVIGFSQSAASKAYHSLDSTYKVLGDSAKIYKEDADILRWTSVVLRQILISDTMIVLIKEMKAVLPKWANKRKFNSFELKQTGGSILKISNNWINTPKLGKLKMVKDADIYGNIKKAIIIKEITGYFICIVTDATKNIQNNDESQVVGLDMGVAKFYVDSNGKICENPKHFKKHERQLRIENRSLARKKKGSNSWKKQAKRIALLHHKIGNVRKDFLHKESTNIAKRYNTVYVEDLNIKGMVRSNLSKSILDCGWATFRTMLSYKTNVVAINPKFTSQTCNDCGAKDAKSRISQSKFVCTSCGVESNADENAAKNILGKGITLTRQREAIACA